MSTIAPSTSCSASRSNASATPSVAGHERQGVSAFRRRFGRGLQHPRVADRGEGGDDEADGLRASGAQGAGGTVRAIPEVGHRALDAGAGVRVDTRAAVDDARHGLPETPARAATMAIDTRPDGDACRPERGSPTRSRSSPTHFLRSPPVHNSAMLTLSRPCGYHVYVNTHDLPELRTETLGAGVVKRATTLATAATSSTTTIRAPRSEPSAPSMPAPRPRAPTPRRCASTCFTGDWITVAANRPEPRHDAQRRRGPARAADTGQPLRGAVALRRRGVREPLPRIRPPSPRPSAPRRRHRTRRAASTNLDRPGLGRTRTSVGRCEVVCFSPDHSGSFGTQSVTRARTVIEAWADRTAAISSCPASSRSSRSRTAARRSGSPCRTRTARSTPTPT